MKKEEIDLIHLEKSIAEKYGEKTIKNPRALWDEEKEKKYLEYLKEISKKSLTTELIEENGVLLQKKLFKKVNNTCISCRKYSFNKNDDIYLSKYQCCFKCFVEYVEDREEKWLKKISQNNA